MLHADGICLNKENVWHKYRFGHVSIAVKEICIFICMYVFMYVDKGWELSLVDNSCVFKCTWAKTAVPKSYKKGRGSQHLNGQYDDCWPGAPAN